MKDMRNDKAMLNEEELDKVNGAGHYETIIIYSTDPYGNPVIHEYTVYFPL